VRWVDTATVQSARAAFADCCKASRWVDAMLDQRPFVTFDRLRSIADEEWERMERADWLEAFAAHPRIGDRSGPEHTRREQSGTAHADPDVLDALTEGNRRYERQFGHVFLINAAGRSADEMLQTLHERLDNDADTEAAVAAEEQRQITKRRLEAMMRPQRERS
jgi:OHCU decarboxylase